MNEIPSVTEWACEPHQQLPIPPEIRQAMRYKFTVYAGQGHQLHGQCEAWDALPGGALHLYNVLNDTSDRALGTLLKKRLTLRHQVIITGAAVVVVSLNADEREPAP